MDCYHPASASTSAHGIVSLGNVKSGNNNATIPTTARVLVSHHALRDPIAENIHRLRVDIGKTSYGSARSIRSIENSYKTGLYFGKNEIVFCGNNSQDFGSPEIAKVKAITRRCRLRQWHNFRLRQTLLITEPQPHSDRHISKTNNGQNY